MDTPMGPVQQRKPLQNTWQPLQMLPTLLAPEREGVADPHPLVRRPFLPQHGAGGAHAHGRSMSWRGYCVLCIECACLGYWGALFWPRECLSHRAQLSHTLGRDITANRPGSCCMRRRVCRFPLSYDNRLTRPHADQSLRGNADSTRPALLRTSEALFCLSRQPELTPNGPVELCSPPGAQHGPAWLGPTSASLPCPGLAQSQGSPLEGFPSVQAGSSASDCEDLQFCFFSCRAHFARVFFSFCSGHSPLQLDRSEGAPPAEFSP